MKSKIAFAVVAASLAAMSPALADWPQRDLRAETQRHYDVYWQGLQHETQLVLARLLQEEAVSLSRAPLESRL